MSAKTPEAAREAAAAALTNLAALTGIATVLEDLKAAQAACDATGAWDTTEGRNVEAAMGYLRMALEAAGVRDY